MKPFASHTDGQPHRDRVPSRAVGPRGRPQVASTTLVAVPAPGEDVDLGSTTATQDQRRVVGQLLRIVGSLLDFGIIVACPYLVLDISTYQYKKLVLVYAVVATLLLVPTQRSLRRVPRPSEQVGVVALRILIAPMILVLVPGQAMFTLESVNLQNFAWVAVATVPAVLLGRLVMFKVIHRVRTRGFDLEDALIVGAGPVGVEVARALAADTESGLRPAAFVDRYDDDLPLPVVGRPEHLRSILERTGVRNVVIAFGAASEVELVDYVRAASGTRVQFYYVPRFFDLGVRLREVAHEVGGYPLIAMSGGGAPTMSAMVKRLFDIAVASLLLVVTAPLMLACAIIIKVSSPGPVLFRQVRIGLAGRPFEILKFRSMLLNEESSTQWSVEDDDRRVTRLGALMRRTHIDELPQLFNVLRGDMAIVGPRPERPYFVEQFSEEIDGYDERHRVPVGITGWAQVHGYWGDSSIETRVRLDNRYIENWSLGRDIIIGLRTIPTFLGRRR